MHAMKDPAPPLAKYLPGVPGLHRRRRRHGARLRQAQSLGGRDELRTAVRVAYAALVADARGRSAPPPAPAGAATVRGPTAAAVRLGSSRRRTASQQPPHYRLAAAAAVHVAAAAAIRVAAAARELAQAEARRSLKEDSIVVTEGSAILEPVPSSTNQWESRRS